jgi:hypothetical protein
LIGGEVAILPRTRPSRISNWKMMFDDDWLKVLRYLRPQESNHEAP